jgi:hypothetical protein
LQAHAVDDPLKRKSSVGIQFERARRNRYREGPAFFDGPLTGCAPAAAFPGQDRGSFSGIYQTSVHGFLGVLFVAGSARMPWCFPVPCRI